MTNAIVSTAWRQAAAMKHEPTQPTHTPHNLQSTNSGRAAVWAAGLSEGAGASDGKAEQGGSERASTMGCTVQPTETVTRDSGAAGDPENSVSAEDSTNSGDHENSVSAEDSINSGSVPSSSSTIGSNEEGSHDTMRSRSNVGSSGRAHVHASSFAHANAHSWARLLHSLAALGVRCTKRSPAAALFTLGACVALPPLLVEGRASDQDCSNALHACVVAELPRKVGVVCCIVCAGCTCGTAACAGGKAC